MRISPLVSIIIPTFNRGYCLTRTIKSVLDQTYSNWELIIVDNYSEDETSDIILGFKDERITEIKFHNNGVVAASRNVGIREAKGEYIALLDSDDWWTAEKLEVCVATLESGFDVVYHDLFVISTLPLRPSHYRRLRTRHLTNPAFKDLLNNGNAINNSSVVVRRRQLQDIGGFSEEKELIAAEDFDGWLRLSQRTDRFRKVDKTMGYYWHGDGNLTAPHRTLSNVLSLKERYFPQILDSDMPGWMVYALSRAYYDSGQFAEASKHALLSLKKGGELPVVAKASYTWTVAKVRILVGGGVIEN